MKYRLVLLLAVVLTLLSTAASYQARHYWYADPPSPHEGAGLGDEFTEYTQFAGGPYNLIGIVLTGPIQRSGVPAFEILGATPGYDNELTPLYYVMYSNPSTNLFTYTLRITGVYPSQRRIHLVRIEDGYWQLSGITEGMETWEPYLIYLPVVLEDRGGG